LQYFLTESDVGKNRAVVSAPRVAELNLYVQVDSFTGGLSSEFLSQFEVSTFCVISVKFEGQK